MKMELFDENIINEFTQWKKANPDSFTWWSYVNMKSDLQTALGFAKFFYPEVIEIDGCFLLKDKYDEVIYRKWLQECNNNKTIIEKMMNLYEIRDFFHINTEFDENEDEQIAALSDVLRLFWGMSFKNRYPQKEIKIDVFEDYGGEIFITVFQSRES
jgi:hypothetical protein